MCVHVCVSRSIFMFGVKPWVQQIFLRWCHLCHDEIVFFIFGMFYTKIKPPLMLALIKPSPNRLTVL